MRKIYVLWGIKNKTGPILHISPLHLRLLSNSKYLLTATSFRTNTIVVTRVHCKIYYKHVIIFIIIITVMWSGDLYHFKLMFQDDSYTRDAYVECGLEIWACPQD